VLEDLPIVVVIVNNGYLGMVQQWQAMFYDERHSHVHLTHQVPEYAALAEAYGAAGFTVEAPDDLEATLAEALAAERTAVVDVRVDPLEQCFPMIPAGAAALDLVEYEETDTVVSAASWDVAGKGGKRAARRTVQTSTDKRRPRSILPPAASGGGGGRLRRPGADAGQGGASA